MKVQKKFENDSKFREVYTEPSEVVQFLEDNINFLVGYWKNNYEKIKAENELLRNNEYVKKVEEENQRLKKRLNSSFEINLSKRKEIEEWQERHLRKKHPDKRWLEYYYEFYPTELGTFGDCVCYYCKEKFDIGEVL